MKIDQSKFEYLNIKKYFKQYKLKKMIANKFLNDYFKNELYKEIFILPCLHKYMLQMQFPCTIILRVDCSLLSKELYLSFSYPNDFLNKKWF